jgi:serine kinase of HPr protein (carbohydrate metabolism regulator)
VTWLAHDGSVWGHAYRVGEERWLSLPSVGRFRFGAVDGDAFVIPDPGVDHEIVVDVYRRCVLPLALHAHGAEVLHASGVVIAGRAVALCAQAHTGKSTLAFAVSRRGHAVWADDAVAFEINGSGAVAVAQPFYLRLRPPARAFFGSAVATNSAAHEVPDRLPLGAVVILERVDHDVELQRLRPAEALDAALDHAYSYDLADPARKRRMIETYTQLVASTPTWRLRFRPGFEEIDEVVDAVEEAFAESADER